ncbi:cytochrome P450 85A-like [Magnolia sinica]|uniref:cytochrome P450 85A-like n=1 Tax=Magnolia sinica TaxID=86752 RepID=UPI00265ABF6D|nr:cytochrome P450 85A-like [Magnolia sinica]
MVVLVLVLVVCVCTAILKWNELRYTKKGVPPGTMGLPLFGETAQFLKQGPSFMKKQRARYGNLFRTHILGCPTVICMDPELNRFILLSEGKGIVASYPKSMVHILGKFNVGSVHGVFHKTLRGAMISLVGPTMIKDQLLSKIDEFMRSHLSDWNDSIINIQDKTKEVALLASLRQFGIESGPVADAFKPEFYKLVLGTISLPIDLPGTNYWCGLRARERILSILRRIMEERRATLSHRNDLLNSLMNERSRFDLTDEQIMDQVITVLHSGFEAISPTVMMAVKYLHDHPRVLEELRKEHFRIRKGKGPDDAIDWDDYKSMEFTRGVIFETIRLATITNGVMRKTTQDMEMNGYVIPKDWKIYVYTREINYDPSLYPEPLTFNPWRWLDNSLESHQHFLIFGGGCRLCLGKELAIVEICTFLHYFVTKYRWEEVGGEEIVKFPRVEAPNGFHIRVWNY